MIGKFKIIFKIIIEKIKKTDKKKLLDVIIGFLTIPSLITVLILNLNNLKNNQKTDIEPTPTPITTQEKTIIIEAPTASRSSENDKDKPKGIPAISFPSPTEQCNTNPDNIKIVYPTEGQIIHDDPFCVSMRIEDSNSCPLEWSYSVNGNSLSNWSNDPICFDDLENGKVDLKIIVKNEKSGLTKNYQINFIYQKESEINENEATPSVTLSN